MVTKELQLHQNAAHDLPLDPNGLLIGFITELNDDGGVSVAFSDNPNPVPARLALFASKQRLETALLLQQPVAVLHEQGDRRRPIIIGIIDKLQETSKTLLGLPEQVLEADVDGNRVRIQGKDEIVLECGQASITLRRNGRVTIRGTHIETVSEGTNRIKGGQVRIN